MSETVKLQLISSSDFNEEPDDITYVEMEIPEWKRTIRLGSINADDLMKWIEANEGPAKRTAGLRLIASSLVDEKNNRIGDPKMLEWLKRRNAAVIKRIVDKIAALNGFGEEAAKQIKNASGEASTDASPTA